MNPATETDLRNEQTPTPAGLVWEEPPTKTGQPGKYAGVAAALQERPGQWAFVRAYPTYKKAGGFAGAVRTGKLIDFRSGGFECRVVTVDGQARVYIRFQPVAEAVSS